MGGFLKQPTPGGVPVRKTSPGAKVTNLTGGREKEHSRDPQSEKEESMSSTAASK